MSADNVHPEKIVSIGEVLLDSYPDVKVIGGAPFNFFYHIHKLTGNAEFISRIGNDDDGKSILNFCTEHNISTAYLQIDEKYPTGRVDVKLDPKGSPEFFIKPECAYDFITLNDNSIQLIEKEVQLIYYGTLAQRSIVTRATIQSLLGRNLKYFCDINLRSNYYNKSLLDVCFKNANVLKLNLEELKIASMYFLGNKFDLNPSAEDLRNKFEIDILSVTLGEKGALIIDSSGKNEYKFPVNGVIDSVGSGDAYAAILCLGYLNKLPVDKINILANKFAAYICTIKGAIPYEDGIYTIINNEMYN
jgi:fructokinase